MVKLNPSKLYSTFLVDLKTQFASVFNDNDMLLATSANSDTNEVKGSDFGFNLYLLNPTQENEYFKIDSQSKFNQALILLNNPNLDNRPRDNAI